MRLEETGKAPCGKWDEELIGRAEEMTRTKMLLDRGTWPHREECIHYTALGTHQVPSPAGGFHQPRTVDEVS